MMAIGLQYAAAPSVAQNLYWAQPIGANSTDVGQGNTIDLNGNQIVTGGFSATVDFNPGSGTFNMAASGGKDVFVLKLDFGGNFVWSKRFSGTGNEEGWSVATDAAGNVYVAGSFTATVDFNPGNGIYNLTSNNNFKDAFICKLDPAGNFLWAHSWGSTGDDESYSVCIDNSGNVLVTGGFFGTIDFDPGTGVTQLTSAGNSDIFVCKLSSAGSLLWAGNMGSSFADFGKVIRTDAADNIYVSGNFNLTADFDPGPNTTNLVSGGLDDIYVCKLDSAGNFVWARKVATGGNNERLGDMTMDSQRNMYFTGNFAGTADFDPSAGAQPYIANGTDAFVSKLDSMGNYVWSGAFSGSFMEDGRCIRVDNTQSVFISGTFAGTTDFDPDLNISANLTTFGLDDIFICKLDSNGLFSYVQQIGGTNYDIPFAMSMTSNGNTFLTGHFSGTADFDPTTGVANITSNGGSSDIFVFAQGPGAVGISETGTSEQISVYPNPAHGYFILDLPSEADVTLLNYAGQTQRTFKAPAGKTTVSIESLPAGIYFIKATSSVSTYLQKVIVTK